MVGGFRLRCEDCDKLVMATGNGQRLCPGCARERKLKYGREYYLRRMQKGAPSEEGAGDSVKRGGKPMPELLP